MYLVVWHQEDEHEIIYEGDSYEKAEEITDDALNHIGSDGFKVTTYQIVKEQWK